MKSSIKIAIAGYVLLIISTPLHAQIIMHIGSGGQVFVSAKTAISFDSLVAVPSQGGWLLGENNISKLAGPNNPFGGSYIKRVYCFSKPVPDYNGSLSIFYNNTEAQSVNVNQLLLQAYDGIGWQPQRDEKARNARCNAAGVLGVHHLSFSELLLGYTSDANNHTAPVALAPLVDAKMNVSLYPNPAVNNVNVQVSSSILVKSVRLYDASGKLLIIKTGNVSNCYEFSVSAFAAGLYNIFVETKDGRQVKQFVKQ